MSDTRQFEMEIDLGHDSETVWNALTKADELARWFPKTAEVEPEVGGQYLLSWESGGCAFDTRIAVWEPNKRLKVVEHREQNGKPVELAMDFTLAGRDGATTLRLVHSGFGRDADWDDEFDGISSGWHFELRMLRDYLDDHRGEDRHLETITHVTELPPREVYERVFGRDGLAKEGNIRALPEGAAYRLVAGPDEVYQGKVFTHQPPKNFVGTVEGDQQGNLRYHMDGQMVFLILSLYGDAGARTKRFAEQWKDRLPALLA
jgi:uncharacterized protein YndB with AHSA1/START domain